MKAWIKWSTAVVVVLIGLLTVAEALLERSARHAATFNGTLRDFHDVSESELEQQIRTSLPLGSSRTAVQNYLSDQRMRFRNSHDRIEAGAPYLKGSNFAIRSSMSITFQFNDDDKLQSIHTAVWLTGP